VVEQKVARPLSQRLQRLALGKILPYPQRFSWLLEFGRLIKPGLSPALQAKVPAPQTAYISFLAKQTELPGQAHKQTRLMLLLDGCAQSVVTPNTNAAIADILHCLKIATIRASGCCGAVNHHLSDADTALALIRRNIDSWWPLIEHGAEAIISSASGCGVMVKEYGYLLRDDPVYAEKAQRVATLAKDISEVLDDEALPRTAFQDELPRVAFHSPCTLQHGQKLGGVVEGILQRAGFELTPVPDAHLCCGSAGTYSLLQAQLSQQLLDNKITALQAGAPDIIATANIGCQLHLGSKATVKHWVEVLAAYLKISNSG
jgi:glycolate oxidase iron-sulfur subunit